MKLFVKDAKLRRHSVDVDEGASVKHLKLLLANMSLVPAGFVPNLVYQTRNLSDADCVSGIGYNPDLSISLVCVRAAPASPAADCKPHSSRPSDGNPPAAAQKAPASLAVAAGGTAAQAAADRPAEPPTPYSSSAASLPAASAAAVPLRAVEALLTGCVSSASSAEALSRNVSELPSINEYLWKQLRAIGRYNQGSGACVSQYLVPAYEVITLIIDSELAIWYLCVNGGVAVREPVPDDQFPCRLAICGHKGTKFEIVSCPELPVDMVVELGGNVEKHVVSTECKFDCSKTRVLNCDFKFSNDDSKVEFPNGPVVCLTDVVVGPQLQFKRAHISLLVLQGNPAWSVGIVPESIVESAICVSSASLAGRAAAQTAAAAVDVSALSDARPVKMIFSMGFDEALVQRALAQAGDNEQGAIDILISGQLHPEDSPSLSTSPLRDGSRVRIKGLQAKPEMNGRTGVVRGAFDAQSGRWTVEVTADELYPSSLFSFRPANLCVIDVRPSSAPPTPTVNVATEWLDELGCVCPKAVDYASQCPKGHLLVPFAGGGCGASTQRVMCRICHTCAQSEQAALWLVCSVAGCCAGYAVCDGCVSALHQAPAAVAAGEGFSSQVNCAAGAAPVLWLTCAAAGRLAAVLAVDARAVWRVARSPDDIAVRENVSAAPNVAAAEQHGG